VRDAPVSVDAGVPEEDEHKICGEQDEDPLTQERFRKQKCLRIRQNLREEVADRERERNAQDKCDHPGRDMEALGCGRHVCMRGESSHRHIAEKIAHAHHADPEEEHCPRRHLPLLRLGIKQTAGDVRDSISDENSGDSDQRSQRAATVRKDRDIIDVFADVGLRENVVQANVSVVEGQRIGLVMKELGSEAVCVLVHEETNSMGKPKLDYNE
jgi:hypothetical protein